MTRLRWLLLAVFPLACSAATAPPPPEGASMQATPTNLTGCKGKASSSIPSDGVYIMTTFGGPSESQTMSCGSSTKNGSWYYAASRQRYGCGALIRIEAGGKCVIAKTDDYGPDVCVENAANRPIIDVSPLVAEHLFGVSGMGWSDNRTVTISVAGAGEQLGPCGASPGGGPADDPGADPGGAGGSGGTSGGAASGGGGASGSGGAAGSCFCDEVCQQYGDCCSDCGSGGNSGGGGSSGSGGASGSGGSGGSACYCDAACVEYNDCCAGCP